MDAIYYGPLRDEFLVCEVAAVHEDEVTPVVSVPYTPSHGLVRRPEGVHTVPPIAQPPSLVVEVSYLSFHDGIAEVGVGNSDQDDASGYVIWKVGALRVSPSEDAAQDGAVFSFGRRLIRFHDLPVYSCLSTFHKHGFSTEV